jgi:hypothetical protein
MGLLRHGYEQSLFRKHVVLLQDRNPYHASRHLGIFRYATFTSGQAPRFAALLLAPLLAASALLPSPAVATERGAAAGGMHMMSDAELSNVSAQGLHDRFFDKIDRFFVNGMAIEVLGDMAALLNPVTGILEADVTFKDAVFNPSNPTTLVDPATGTTYIRLPASIGEVSVRNIRMKGSTGPSFGDVTIRDIRFNGTTIRISKRQ